MFFDTHCHLNFKAYRKTLQETIIGAREQGISRIVIPGTNVPTSRRAVEIAEANDGLYVAAGIHPHHVFELYVQQKQDTDSTDNLIAEQLKEIESLLSHPKVVAVGELGLDRHMYIETKYENYTVDEAFVTLQKRIMAEQLALAVRYRKAVVIHNREASGDLLMLMATSWDEALREKAVFHCCEANDELLAFAIDHDIFIGVDGDITYGPEKKEFVRKVPRNRLVLETDGPYLLPEPLRANKLYPNKPGNLPVIARAVAEAWELSEDEVARITTENGERLFGLS
jgi:TatD DNase family protein